jgi:hypothetical protein
MSKQSEAQIGVETSFMVCYSKNDSPINMHRRKVVNTFGKYDTSTTLMKVIFPTPDAPETRQCQTKSSLGDLPWCALNLDM